MRRIYYLSTCSTCQRILKELPSLNSFELIDVKQYPITEQALDELKIHIGSYDSLLNKRAKKYQEGAYAKRNLTERQIRKLILSDYTFLKRPVILAGDFCVAGNSKPLVESAISLIEKLDK